MDIVIFNEFLFYGIQAYQRRREEAHGFVQVGPQGTSSARRPLYDGWLDEPRSRATQFAPNSIRGTNSLQEPPHVPLAVRPLQPSAYSVPIDRSNKEAVSAAAQPLMRALGHSGLQGAIPRRSSTGAAQACTTAAAGSSSEASSRNSPFSGASSASPSTEGMVHARNNRKISEPPRRPSNHNGSFPVCGNSPSSLPQSPVAAAPGPSPGVLASPCDPRLCQRTGGPCHGPSPQYCRNTGALYQTFRRADSALSLQSPNMSSVLRVAGQIAGQIVAVAPQLQQEGTGALHGGKSRIDSVCRDVANQVWLNLQIVCTIEINSRLFGAQNQTLH